MIAELARRETPAAPPARHVLVLASPESDLQGIPGGEVLRAMLERRSASWAKAARNLPLAGEVEGALVSWVPVDADASAFVVHEAIRRGLEPLLREEPAELEIVIAAGGARAEALARAGLYVAWVNGRYRSGRTRRSLGRIHLSGIAGGIEFHREGARARGNLLARELTQDPAHRRSPARFRTALRELARVRGWGVEEHGVEALRERGAGAFCAVARGSGNADAAIVRLQYRPAGSEGERTVALVGKGICMDTGGYGLKTAREMHGMHEDLNGAAVAVGILEAADALGLRQPIDAWLAVADNLLGADAYVPGEVVTALDRSTIEVVHPDAEGRMVLADTLCMGASLAPRAMLSFATLTNAMVCALGTRMSGVFANRPELLPVAVESGRLTGERVVAFPLEPDYDEVLRSSVADIRQCDDLGNADHILAARFLQRFVSDTPWLHMDLSAYRHRGGLGAVTEDVTGFGVGWGLEMVERLAAG